MDRKGYLYYVWFFMYMGGGDVLAVSHLLRDLDRAEL
jgi:hypothetical protein